MYSKLWCYKFQKLGREKRIKINYPKYEIRNAKIMYVKCNVMIEVGDWSNNLPVFLLERILSPVPAFQDCQAVRPFFLANLLGTSFF